MKRQNRLIMQKWMRKLSYVVSHENSHANRTRASLNQEALSFIIEASAALRRRLSGASACMNSGDWAGRDLADRPVPSVSID